MSRRRKIAAAIFSVIIVFGLSAAPSWADQTYVTPRAGEAYTTTLGGEAVTVPPRDRRSVTALNLGLYGIPNGPRDANVAPFGALFIWRNWDNGRERFRGEIAGIYNALRYHRALSPLDGLELVLTFDNLTVPIDRAEYAEAVRLSSEELMWHQFRLGLGLGWRRALAPGHQDNALELTLTYEPGALLFARGNETAPGFVMPADTYEGRLHLRLRADALERNVLELPHAGLAAGLDGWAGHRAHWRDWGGGPSGLQDGSAHRAWLALSGYVVAAGAWPFSPAQRHRLIASAYGGVGARLDRFSAFRLGGGPGGGEWETLARPLVPGAAFGELFPSDYLVLNVEYRYELLFFLYLHLRGSMAWVDLFRFQGGGLIDRTDGLHSVSAAVTSGFLWNSQLELGYSHNFGLFRIDEGVSRRGRDALLISWSKEF